MIAVLHRAAVMIEDRAKKNKKNETRSVGNPHISLKNLTIFCQTALCLVSVCRIECISLVTQMTRGVDTAK